MRHAFGPLNAKGSPSVRHNKLGTMRACTVAPPHLNRLVNEARNHVCADEEIPSAMSLPQAPHSAVSQWHAHRQALTLAVSAEESEDVRQAVKWLSTAEDGFDRGGFLSQHGLAAIAARRLRSWGKLSQIPENVSELLSNELRTASVIYLAQVHWLAVIVNSLERHDISYVVFKGASVREAVYDIPSNRVACDIDLLIHPQSRAEVTERLTQCGFNEQPASQDSAHERTFSNGNVDIDVHWEILRPGRTRRPMVDSILADRVRGAKFHCPSNADTVFLMLVHPAFAKYVCSPHMGLNRVLDFVLFTNGREIDWDAVATRLDETGMKAAGWCTLRWFQHVTPVPLAVPVSFVDAISPGKFRRAYLAFWIAHDLPGRLLGRCDWLIRGAFTLLLHDRADDAWRALRARLRPHAVARSQGAGIV